MRKCFCPTRRALKTLTWALLSLICFIKLNEGWTNATAFLSGLVSIQNFHFGTFSSARKQRYINLDLFFLWVKGEENSHLAAHDQNSITKQNYKTNYNQNAWESLEWMAGKWAEQEAVVLCQSDTIININIRALLQLYLSLIEKKAVHLNLTFVLFIVTTCKSWEELLTFQRRGGGLDGDSMTCWPPISYSGHCFRVSSSEPL